MSAEVAYLDASAVVKVASAGGRNHGASPPAEKLAAARIICPAARRASPHCETRRTARLMEAARRQLASIDLIRLDDDLLERASEIEASTVRSLDAIDLATALDLGSDLAAVVTYDTRMSAAAQALGLPVIAPR
jgi:uncharacterized protein